MEGLQLGQPVGSFRGGGRLRLPSSSRTPTLSRAEWPVGDATAQGPTLLNQRLFPLPEGLMGSPDLLLFTYCK